MVQYEWDEEACRTYAEKMEKLVKHDHRPWAKRIAEALGETAAGDKLMDVATGPGFLLFELASLLSGMKLYAQDEAEPMLEIARERAATAGFEIETVNSPAEKISLEAGFIDVVACKNLLHECHDVDEVIGEIHRVLKSGGKAFVIDFDADGSKLAAWLIRMFIRLSQGREMSKAYWTSFSAGLRGTAVREKMLAAGFDSVEYVKSGPSYLLIGEKK